MTCTLSGPVRRCFLLAVAAGLLVAGSTRLFAVDGVNIVHVEEDWELVVLEPDSDTTAPQVTCMMSPTGDEDGLHMTFELNHKSGSQFVAGGLTMQLWNGESWVTTKRGDSSAAMSTAAETVRWTQSMKINGTNLTFEIKNGTSSSWGGFGDGSEKLKSTTTWGPTNIIGYSPETSVRLSGIGFASNRVQSLVLKRVRVYAPSGEIHEDTTPRTVYQHE
ncbi:MAG: hypothetical protein ACR2FY_23300 [Pirellulaceae bacterium]